MIHSFIYLTDYFEIPSDLLKDVKQYFNAEYRAYAEGYEELCTFGMDIALCWVEALIKMKIKNITSTIRKGGYNDKIEK